MKKTNTNLKLVRQSAQPKIEKNELEAEGRFLRWHPELVQRNRLILRLRRQGFSAKEIAKQHGLTPQQIYNVCGSGQKHQRQWTPYYGRRSPGQMAYDLYRVNPSRSWDQIAQILQLMNGAYAEHQAEGYARQNKLQFPIPIE